MKLQKTTKSSNRKMVHIHTDTHLKIQQLALYTGKPINELVDMLLVDALSRVELVESDEPSLQWECRHCGKLIPYMYDFCSECAEKLLGEPPKPFDPQESEG